MTGSPGPIPNTSARLLRHRAAWYRRGCDGVNDREGYWTSGDLLRDVADDLEKALDLRDAVVRERNDARATLEQTVETSARTVLELSATIATLTRERDAALIRVAAAADVGAGLPPVSE